MLQLRSSCIFDAPVSVDFSSCRTVGLSVGRVPALLDGAPIQVDLAWITGGARAGFRALVARGPDGGLYAAGSLFPDVLVRQRDEAALAVAAIAARCALIGTIEPMGALPGWEHGENGWHHPAGWWWCRADYALPVAEPTWAPGARAWRTACGVFVAFPDGTCRMSRARDYFQFDTWIEGAGVVGRQGDCFAVGRPPPFESVGWGGPWGFATVRPEGTELGRHRAVMAEGGCWALEHPEHDRVPLDHPPFGLALLPGESRREAGGD